MLLVVATKTNDSIELCHCITINTSTRVLENVGVRLTLRVKENVGVTDLVNETVTVSARVLL